MATGRAGGGDEVSLRLIWILSFSVLIANMQDGIHNTQTKLRNDTKIHSQMTPEGVSNIGAVK